MHGVPDPMNSHHMIRPLLGLCLGAVGLLGAGSQTYADEPKSAPAPTTCNRDHVYVFMVNGLGLFTHVYGSMDPMARTLDEHGYVHHETATHHYRWSFQDKIRCIHQSDSRARIVLVGFSMGSGVIHSMARNLEKEGIPIALMVYLDGHCICDSFDERFCNVGRVVNITSTGPVLRGACVPHADCSLQIPSFHHGVPKKEQTLQFLVDELDAVAASVPAPTMVNEARERRSSRRPARTTA